MQTKSIQITIRNVDKQLKKLIDQNAKKQNKSINQFVIDIMRSNLGSAPPSMPKNRLESHIPLSAYNSDLLQDFEKIDESMWQ